MQPTSPQDPGCPPAATVRVVVDGAARDVASGTVLDGLRRIGVDVPTLCHDDRLAPHAVCRLCVVEIDGVARPACRTLLEEGMSVVTKSDAITAERRVVLASLAAHHPPSVARDAEPHDFLRRLRDAGLEAALAGHEDPALVDDDHPYIHIDMSRCIDCFRCVQICRDVQGADVWSAFGRGDETRVRAGTGQTLLEAGCVSCGACVTTCPTGALEDKTLRERGAPTARTRTTCPYCGVGCELDVRTKAGRIVQILPVDTAPVNQGHLCSKGRYAWGFVESGDRVTTPLVRHGDGWRAVSWESAMATVAARLLAIRDRHGPDALAMVSSARATNEDNYVAQKLARVVFGTNNVDCCARVCHSPSAAALAKTLGTGAATSSYDDIELARTILVCGANATEAHPVIGARILQAARRGANLIVIDPRRTELAAMPGAVHLALRPGANVPLLNALAAVIVEEGLVDYAFLRERVDGLDELRAHLASFRPEDVGELCGVDAALIRRAARLYAASAPSISFHGLGMTEHVQGTDGVTAIVNLALLTGNLGKPGTGVNPLRGQNNVQGSAHMGCEPGRLTGYAPLDAAAGSFSSAWNAAVPRAPGLRLGGMFDAAAEGRLSAMWIMGYDVLQTSPDTAHVRDALSKLELLVVQDLFLNETARAFGHVFFPAAASYEKDGTFMNAERRVQRVRKAIEPPGEARGDWEALCELARAMGHRDGFAFGSAEDVWNEIRAVWPAGRGITYERLEHGGLQWPCPDEAHPGTKRLHVEAFTSGPRARLRCLEHIPTAERTSPEFPFVLVTGRSLHAFNAGTMTGRTLHRSLRPTDRLDVAPQDASRLGLREGDDAIVASRRASTRLPVHVDPAMKPGEVFATFAEAETGMNELVGPGRDRETDTPEYKITAVRIGRGSERETGAEKR